MKLTPLLDYQSSWVDLLSSVPNFSLSCVYKELAYITNCFFFTIHRKKCSKQRKTSLSWLKRIPSGSKLLGSSILSSLSHTVVLLVPHQLASEHIMSNDGYYICTIIDPIYGLNISNSNIDRHTTREYHLQPSSETPNQKKILLVVNFSLFFMVFATQHDWPQVHMCPPHLEAPNLPSRLIPPGRPRAPALGALLHASNLHWPSILRMVTYMFQCYYLKSFHPRLLPQSPKVCTLHLWRGWNLS